MYYEYSIKMAWKKSVVHMIMILKLNKSIKYKNVSFK